VTGAEWIEDHVLRVDGVDLVARTTERFTSTPTRFCLVKPRDLVERYLALLADLRPRSIVELGIFQGGSVALSALVAQPEHLLAVELAPTRIAALDELVASRSLSDRVHVHHGVDQGDAARLTALLEEAGIVAPELDLVVDDASHLVDPTRRSFEVLFPYLRPGGRYVIEDWAWAHVGYESHLPDEQPLSQVVFELVLALPSNPGLIADITIDHDWAVITRGDRPIDASTAFDLRSLVGPRGRGMLADQDAGPG
jgi:predicted O-methyltransferase YrrM